MNKDWSELNKTMQAQLKKAETFQAGIGTLFDLRDKLMNTLLSVKASLNGADFAALPFRNADGNHSTTIAWSLWHVFRIEDIVAHTLISDGEQVFAAGNYQQRINAPIITTANELSKEEIVEFSRQLNIEELYNYAAAVKASTEKLVRQLPFSAMKQKVTEERRRHLESLNAVSKDEESWWLIDYWCSKDIRGLIQMPLSRHWIMHVEAILKIRDKLLKGT